MKYYGMMLMGIGLVFYGMGLMSDAMTPLRSFEPFLAILSGLKKPAAGILAGAVFTAIVQSSAATVGIALAMLNDLGPGWKDRDTARVEAVARRDDEIDVLEAEILRYLGRIRTGMLTEEESKELERLITATDNIESLADVIETDVVALARKAADISSVSGEETRAKLGEIYLSVAAAF
jgi:Na+/phosphate symporter